MAAISVTLVPRAISCPTFNYIHRIDLSHRSDQGMLYMDVRYYSSHNHYANFYQRANELPTASAKSDSMTPPPPTSARLWASFSTASVFNFPVKFNPVRPSP